MHLTEILLQGYVIQHLNGVSLKVRSDSACGKKESIADLLNPEIPEFYIFEDVAHIVDIEPNSHFFHY